MSTFIKQIVFSLFLSLNLLTIASYSQNRISGIVFDKDSKESLIGANIYFPDLHKGGVSDSNGEFSISNIPTGKFDMLISYLGYQSQLIRLQTDTVSSKIQIFLKQEAFQTQEIIISGSRFSLQHENAIEVNSLKLRESTQNKMNLMEKIAELPGVDVISKGAGIAKPVIRGLSNTNILFIDNGIRMENFQFSNDHPFMVDEFGIDHIEVIKGPASLLYGSDAVGGVLYSVRENPPHGDGFEGDYSLQYFDNSKGVHSSLGLRAAKNNFHLGIRTSIKSHKDYIDGNDQQVPNTRFTQKSIKSVLGYSYKIGNFDLFYDYTEMQLGICIPPAIALITENDYKNKFWYQDLSSHVLSAKNKLFFNNLKLDINLAFQSNHRTLLASELTPQFKIVDMLLNTLSSEIKASYSFANSELIFGTQAMHQSNENADAPNHIIPDAQKNDLSGFSLFSINFNKKTHFQSGLRYDYRQIHFEENSKMDEVRKNYNNLSFSAGVSYQATEKLVLRTNLASGHRTPNLAELSQDGMHAAYYEKGNIDLKSQRNYEPDISLHYHSKLFIFEVSSYLNQITNFIYLQKTLQTTPDNIPIYQYSQTDAKIFGIETGLKIMPIKIVQLSFNYAYIRANQTNGKALPFIPQNKIHFDLNLSKEQLSFMENPYFNINVNYAFRQLHPAQFETETPQYFVANASLGFQKKFDKQSITFSVGVNNLFDAKYIDHLSTLKDLNYYQTGRNIYLRASVKF